MSNAEVVVHGPEKFWPINEYYVVTCGDVRVDVQDGNVSLNHVARGWYLNNDVDIEDLSKVLKYIDWLLKFDE